MNGTPPLAESTAIGMPRSPYESFLGNQKRKTVSPSSNSSKQSLLGSTQKESHILTNAQSRGIVKCLENYYDELQNEAEKSKLESPTSPESQRNLVRSSSVRIAPPSKTIMNRDIRAAILRSNSFQLGANVPKLLPTKMRDKENDSHQIITNHDPLPIHENPQTTKSVLGALEKNCRKRINNEELTMDRNKRFRATNAQPEVVDSPSPREFVSTIQQSSKRGSSSDKSPTIPESLPNKDDEPKINFDKPRENPQHSDIDILRHVEKQNLSIMLSGLSDGFKSPGDEIRKDFVDAPASVSISFTTSTTSSTVAPISAAVSAVKPSDTGSNALSSLLKPIVSTAAITSIGSGFSLIPSVATTSSGSLLNSTTTTSTSAIVTTSIAPSIATTSSTTSSAASYTLFGECFRKHYGESNQNTSEFSFTLRSPYKVSTNNLTKIFGGSSSNIAQTSQPIPTTGGPQSAPVAGNGLNFQGTQPSLTPQPSSSGGMFNIGTGGNQQQRRPIRQATRRMK